MILLVSKVRDVNFPTEGWVVMMTLVKNGLYEVTYTMYPVFISLRLVQQQLQTVAWEFEKDGWLVEDRIKLLTLEFDSLFPLEPRFWAKPVIKYSPTTRADEFKRVLEAPSWYKLLVTPNELGHEGFGLVAAMPVRIGHEGDIMHFMTMTDFPVNTRAKNAGIYKVIKSLEMNWHTGEVRNEEHRFAKLRLN